MENQVCKVLGNNIKKIRKRKGMKQEDLAELIGLEVKSLSLIETGKGFASAKTIEKILSVLNVTLTDLFTVEDEKETTIIYQQILDNMHLFKHDLAKLKTVSIVVKSLI